MAYMYVCIVLFAHVCCIGVELSRRHSLYLCALGPAVVSLSACDNVSTHTDVTSYAHLLDDALLQDVDAALLMVPQATLQQQLADRLLLVFNPRNHTHYQRYSPKATSQHMQQKAVHVTRREEERERCSRQCDVEACELRTDMAPSVHRGLRLAIADNGGIGSFLFLFAKVREEGSAASSSFFPR